MSPENNGKSKPGNAFEITIKILTIICIIAVEVSLFVKFFELDEVTMPLITAIVVFGILLFVALRQLLSIKFKDPLNELKDKTKKLTDNIRELEFKTKKLTDNITKLVMASMSKEMYKRLKNIEECVMPYDEKNESFRKELEYLDALGYIELKHDDPKKLCNETPCNMYKIAKITTLGIDYIRLRDSFK